MIAGLKPYPAMKDSGVEWLGEVPEHWDVRRLGNLLMERGETNANGEVTEVLSVLKDRGVIPYSQKGNIGNKASEDTTRYKVVRPDDIVMNCMNVIIGSVGLSKYTGCLSPVYYVLKRRSESDDPRFLNAYFQTKPFQKSLVRIGNGILAHRMRIPMELLKCELFPRPPADEQAAIVRYLDHVDRRVRRLVRAKRKLIALLTEQKQAIIHRAVTRGLDPDVPLKDSGVEWLGEVPEHWEVVRLGKLLRERGETNKAGEVTHVLSLLRDRGVIPYDEKGNIGNKKSDDITRYKVVHPNDIVMNCMNVIIGSVGLASEKGCLSPVYYVLTARGQDHPRYLNAIFQCPRFHRSLVRIGNGILAHRMRIPMELLKCELFPVPPVDEQSAIVDFLDQATADIDTTITRAEREIELLNEYRTRLIADVVTGKLDVRNAAAALPEVDPLAEADDAGELDADLALDADELDEAPEEVEA